AFALGLLKDARAVAPLLQLIRSVPSTDQRAPQREAVTAIAKIGGDVGARALSDIIAGGSPDAATPVINAALLEAWRLGPRAPVASLVRFAGATDRRHGLGLPGETAVGVLRGSVAIDALRAHLTSSVFAIKRQALIALAQADSAAGVSAAAAVTGDADWRWRSVAAEAFGAARA